MIELKQAWGLYPRHRQAEIIQINCIINRMGTLEIAGPSSF